MYAGCLPHFSSHDVAADWHMIVFMNPAITGSGTCEAPAQSANFRGDIATVSLHEMNIGTPKNTLPRMINLLV